LKGEEEDCSLNTASIFVDTSQLQPCWPSILAQLNISDNAKSTTRPTASVSCFVYLSRFPRQSRNVLLKELRDLFTEDVSLQKSAHSSTLVDFPTRF